MKNKSIRIEWVDWLKGLAIFLIVFGHTIPYSDKLSTIQHYIVSFHVPLFFLISGFLIKKSDEKFLTYAKRKFLSIMIPFYIFGILYMVPYFFWGNSVAVNLDKDGYVSVFQNFLALLYGSGRNGMLSQNSSLWFLPCYFSSMIICKIIDNNFEDNCKNNIIICILFFVIGFTIYNFFNISLPYCFEIAIVMTGFVYAGKFIKNSKILESKKWIILFLTFIILGFGLHFINGNVSCMANYYSKNYLVFVCSSLFTILGLMLLFSHIKGNVLLPLKMLGVNSLAILLLHKPLIILFQTKFGIVTKLMLHGNFFVEFGLCMICAILSIILSLVVYKITNKFVPLIYGNFKKGY